MTAPNTVVTSELLSHWWTRPAKHEVDAWPERPADAQALLDEYERLFVGPAQVPCPPYESFWREDVPIDLRRTLVGPCTAELTALYRKLGLEVTVELEDHVAVELEALAYAESVGHEDLAGAIFSDHLRRWLPRFCRAVTRESEHPFYKDLAADTMTWLQSRSAQSCQ